MDDGHGWGHVRQEAGGLSLGGNRVAWLNEERGAVTGTSPTVRQRELGKSLRQLRHDLGWTVEDVGEKLLCSATKISRIETCQRRPSLRDVRDLCRLYGVGQEETAELMELARMAREAGWWRQYSDINLDPYIGLEQVASSVTCFSSYHVPALLQTEAYAREIIRAIARRIEPEIHKQRVEVRLRRQHRLDQDDRPRYRAVLDEAVLRRRVGGTAVMAGQLEKILKLEREGKATVQVIPFEVGAHAAADGNFVLLEFQGSSPLVFVEGLTANLYLERDSDLDRYREAMEYLRDEALSPRDSITRIAEMQKKYASE